MDEKHTITSYQDNMEVDQTVKNIKIPDAGDVFRVSSLIARIMGFLDWKREIITFRRVNKIFRNDLSFHFKCENNDIYFLCQHSDLKDAIKKQVCPSLQNLALFYYQTQNIRPDKCIFQYDVKFTKHRKAEIDKKAATTANVNANNDTSSIYLLSIKTVTTNDNDKNKKKENDRDDEKENIKTKNNRTQPQKQQKQEEQPQKQEKTCIFDPFALIENISKKLGECDGTRVNALSSDVEQSGIFGALYLIKPIENRIKDLFYNNSMFRHSIMNTLHVYGHGLLHSQNTFQRMLQNSKMVNTFGISSIEIVTIGLLCMKGNFKLYKSLISCINLKVNDISRGCSELFCTEFLFICLFCRYDLLVEYPFLNTWYVINDSNHNEFGISYDNMSGAALEGLLCLIDPNYLLIMKNDLISNFMFPLSIKYEENEFDLIKNKRFLPENRLKMLHVLCFSSFFISSLICGKYIAINNNNVTDVTIIKQRILYTRLRNLVMNMYNNIDYFVLKWRLNSYDKYKNNKSKQIELHLQFKKIMEGIFGFSQIYTLYNDQTFKFTLNRGITEQMRRTIDFVNLLPDKQNIDARYDQIIMARNGIIEAQLAQLMKRPLSDRVCNIFSNPNDADTADFSIIDDYDYDDTAIIDGTDNKSNDCKETEYKAFEFDITNEEENIQTIKQYYHELVQLYDHWKHVGAGVVYLKKFVDVVCYCTKDTTKEIYDIENFATKRYFELIDGDSKFNLPRELVATMKLEYQLIDATIDLHNVLLDAAENKFNGNGSLTTLIMKSFEVLVNDNHHFREYLCYALAKYCHFKILLLVNNKNKNKNKHGKNKMVNKNESELENDLNDIVDIFKHVNESHKYIFEREYQNYLGIRLLQDKSRSLYLEKQMINKLSYVTGKHLEWTNKLSEMISDIQRSSTIFLKYKNNYNNMIDFNVRLCTETSWPNLRYTVNYDTIVNNSDDKLSVLMNDFNVFYQKQYDNTRKLTYLMHQGNGVVLIKFNESTQCEFICSTYQMLILLLFNKKNKYTFKEICDKSGINIIDCMINILSMAHPKVNILKKYPNNSECNDNDTFEINLNCYKESKTQRINVPVFKFDKNKSVMKLKNSENESESEKESRQKTSIREAIRNTMILKRVIKHNILVCEIIKQVKFLPKMNIINECITEIVNSASQIKRHERDKKTYIYSSNTPK